MRGTVTGFHRSFGFVNIKYVAYYYIYICTYEGQASFCNMDSNDSKWFVTEPSDSVPKQGVQNCFVDSASGAQLHSRPTLKAMQLPV